MSTEIQKPAPSIRSLIESDAFKAQVAKALPSHMTPERMIRVAITTLAKVPKLAECDQGSLFNSLLTCSQLGIEPDGRRAYLIPYGKTCQLIIGWQGLVELAKRNGDVVDVRADVVREGDLFDYNMGAVEKHVPHFLRRDTAKPSGAGVVYAAYATAIYRDGTTHSEVLSAEEIDDVKRRSKASGSGPWVDFWNEMAKKTAVRRLCKWLTLSPEIADAIDQEDDTPPIRNVTPRQAVDFAGLVEMAPNAQQVEPVEPAQ